MATEDTSCVFRVRFGRTVNNSSKNHLKKRSLTSAFFCVICLNTVQPPIYQCINGHLICNFCIANRNSCETCNEPLGAVRNLLLEKVAVSLKFNCKFNHLGCARSLHILEKNQHEQVCQHRGATCHCPDEFCDWLGRSDTLIYHLTSSHKADSTCDGDDIIFLVSEILQPDVDFLILHKKLGMSFMFLMVKSEKVAGYEQFFCVIQVVGVGAYAEGYSCRLELRNENRVLAWESKIGSIVEKMRTLIEEGECFQFDKDTVNLFQNEGKLRIRMTISQTHDEKLTNNGAAQRESTSRHTSCVPYK